MGYDVYMRWEGQTKDEEAAQITGYSITHGHVGYLRESFGGNGHSYVKALLPDACWTEEEVLVPADDLRARLTAALYESRARYEGQPETIEWSKQSLIDFVELAEKKEAELGQPVTIILS